MGCHDHFPGFPPPPPVINPNYPFPDNVHNECNCCVHMPPPPPPAPPHRDSGWMTENTFTIVNNKPYLYDNTRTKYGQFIRVSENVNTNIYQRQDPSCINLCATLDMTEATTTNIVLNHYLVQTIQNAYDAIGGVLPVLRSFVKFKMYYTVKDRSMGVVHESSIIVTTEDMKFHTTDIKDYFISSFSNIFIGSIPVFDYQDIYTLIVDRVEAYVDIVDVQAHITDDMNPYYQFIKNNTKIAVQHDTITKEPPDESVLLGVCEINKAFAFQSNVTTRIKMSFNAFLSGIIMTPNTFDVWNALYEPSDAKIRQMQSDILNLQDDNKKIHERLDQITLENETMKADITTLTNNYETLKKRVDEIVVGGGGYTKSEIDKMISDLNKEINTKVTSVDGKGLSTNDYTDEDKALVHSGTKTKQIEFGSYIEFPTIGKEDTLYIAKDKNLSYLWNDTTKTYEHMKIDYDTIQSILGDNPNP